MRNQIVALLQLHVDVGKRVLTIVPQFHEIVVDADAPYYEEHNHYENDNQCHNTKCLNVYVFDGKDKRKVVKSYIF